MDFTNLNWPCPKDPFQVPKIDQVVDATCGHPRMSLLDAFQDQEKTTFISLKANYHYMVMPFRSKKCRGYLLEDDD